MCVRLFTWKINYMKPKPTVSPKKYESCRSMKSSKLAAAVKLMLRHRPPKMLPLLCTRVAVPVLQKVCCWRTKIVLQHLKVLRMLWIFFTMTFLLGEFVDATKIIVSWIIVSYFVALFQSFAAGSRFWIARWKFGSLNWRTSWLFNSFNAHGWKQQN